MARLRSEIIVGGLLRAAEAVGGNGAILARGDPDAGALMTVLTSRGAVHAILERVSSITQGFTWNVVNSGDSGDPQTVARLIDRKKRFDPDIWIVELDVSNAEQFIADSLSET